MKILMLAKPVSGLLFIFLIFFSGSIFSQEKTDLWDFNYTKAIGEDVLDLRYLNEKTAGENGFVSLSDDGNSFVDGAGKPIRFWSVNRGTQARNFSDSELSEYARFLAKMGVNMIRFHGSINPAGKGTLINEVDTAEVDAIWRMVAAMKKEGIYSTISPFWAHNGHMGGWIPEEWGIEGYSGKDDLWGVMYFNDTLKQAYKTWVKYLYTEINPYTGLALKDDASVALIQIKNEDGVFFWTISNVKPELEKVMMQLFYKWAVKKYKTIEQAFLEWEGEKNAKDNLESEELGIAHMYETTQIQTGGKHKRLADQVEFMGERQYDFYKEIYTYYRELGCKQLINANNWKTASANFLFDAERYSNSACEVLAVNRYFSPGHVGENSGWRIDPGHQYTGKSCLFDPHKLPVNIKQAVGHPVLVTESGWNLPNKYQAEGPFLVSAFMSLTGVDSYYWFCPSAINYDENPYFHWTHFEGGQHPLHRWTLSTPGQLAMFPANAFIFRKGLIAPGKTMVHEERSKKEIYGLQMPLIGEENSFDPNRDSYDLINPGAETKVSPLAHLAGKVEVVYEGQPENSEINPQLNQLIDYKNKTIQTSNQQIFWDYETGCCTVNAPAAQGFCGFTTANEKIELNDIEIESENNYLVLNAVALDENPLKTATKILVQVGTTYRPTNWRETPSEIEINNNKVKGFRIDNTGKMPWQAEKTKVVLLLNNKEINKVSLLKVNGSRDKDVEFERQNEGIRIQLPENTMYLILEKQQ